MGMQQYFQAKVGQDIYRTVTTGVNAAFNKPPFAREYKASVLFLFEDGDQFVRVHVTREDKVTSGTHMSGTRRYLGDFSICLRDMNGLDDFWHDIITKADYGFLSYWPGRGGTR